MDFSDTPTDPTRNPVADYDHTELPGDFRVNDRMFEFRKYAAASYAWIYSMGTPDTHTDYTWDRNINPDHPAPALTITLEYQTPGMWVLNARATLGPDNPTKFTPLGQQYHELYVNTDSDFKTACNKIKDLAARATENALPIAPDHQVIAALNDNDEPTEEPNADNYPE